MTTFVLVLGDPFPAEKMTSCRLLFIPSNSLATTEQRDRTGPSFFPHPLQSGVDRKNRIWNVDLSGHEPYFDIVRRNPMKMTIC